MDRELAMAVNCEARFGSCNRDTSVNQAHNQQRGKTCRGVKTVIGKLNTSVKLAAVVVVAVASLFAVHDLPLYPVPLTR